MKEIYDIPSGFSDACINPENYEKHYKESVEDPNKFWAKESEKLSWFKPFDKVSEWDFKTTDIKWFIGGKINACYNCVDRHLPEHKDKIAYYWEPENLNEPHKEITYQQLSDNVNRLSSVLINLGVNKGDRVIIYMPLVPEIIYACLACARIGAIHSVVFGGFSAEALLSRIQDCKPSLVLTADGGFRGGKILNLKNICDDALTKYEVEKCLVLKRTNNQINMKDGRDFWWHDELAKSTVQNYVKPVELDAEDPLFILYTSGSTGKPKGVLHTTAGYLLYGSSVFSYAFDYRPNDIFWCTADIGWITGHTYVMYSPLSVAATIVIYEGAPNCPDYGRFWDVVDKFKVTLFNTAPTAIRAILREGDELVNKRSLASLRIISTIGEPINPEVWHWYYQVIGKGKCPVVDMYWQTETGAGMIMPLPGAIKNKPGAASVPFFGIMPEILDPATGEVLEGPCDGVLVYKTAWPGIMRTVYGDHQRLYDTYFSQYAGYYFTGDGCKRDKDGYYWITGRVDDVLNVSGHRLGTAEIESAIVEHQSVAETAVVGMPHSIKGQGIYAFVRLKVGFNPTDNLFKELNFLIRKNIGGIAAIDFVQWVPDLPKTRSGKIMRRILRKIVEKDESNIGDISTLNDPSVVKNIIDNRVI